ncbi:glycosyltransferase family 2 protein [Alkalibacillus haloalkaliphilus]|uniref:glycosyltransferase family 2 protein n=1 Tax=Alkalibacillus haloalkaliphilus TaxID=94136 RepID=UPI002935A484|nr:glycosyltransferase family 2 protein [Alkalibacillus haloalkaliphilus]MDV2582163.1 glycosyltransferase family 2 protein [Alkalibacillus haloalkaliphilus]
METKVSVIIPTFSRPDSLPRAINSVLNQTYKNIEVIIVDDNDPNTDYRKQTEGVMKAFLKDSRVKYVKHVRNLNGSAARNTGFRNSNGDLVMFLDDDDEFTNVKVESQVNDLTNRDDSWGASYTKYVRKSGGRKVIVSKEKREGSLLKEELKRNLFVHAGSNLMVRRSVFEELGGFDESFTRNQDVEFLVRLLKKYKLAYTDVYGLIVHVTKKNIPRSFENVTNDFLEKFECTINELELIDKEEVYTMIQLQLLRNYILKERKFYKSLKLSFENKLKLSLILRYFLHLLNRKLTRRAYGFKLNFK